jgi:hypothetical protein
MCGYPSPICNEHFGAQINKANQIKTVDMYGDNVKTAAGFPGGSFMHVHEEIVNVVGNGLQRAHVMHKRGVGTFISGTVNGNKELKSD